MGRCGRSADAPPAAGLDCATHFLRNAASARRFWLERAKERDMSGLLALLDDVASIAKVAAARWTM